mgnify:FL=1
MPSTEDILFAIDWLESNDCPVESEPLERVADMLRSTLDKRQRARQRRLTAKLLKEAREGGA